jgi:hypothetical protein
MTPLQIQLQVPLIQGGFRPSLTVRIRPQNWPNVKTPVEERVQNYEDCWLRPNFFEESTNTNFD